MLQCETLYNEEMAARVMAKWIELGMACPCSSGGGCPLTAFRGAGEERNPKAA